MAVNENKSVWRNFDIRSFPITDNTLSYRDEYLLIDNIGVENDKDVSSRYVANGYPYKLSFTCIMFCVRGELHTQINLENLDMRAGDVVVGLPGSIGETKKLSDDCQVAIIACNGTNLYSDADKSINMLFQKYFTRKKLIHLSAEDFNEAMDIYAQMRRKLAQPEFKFAGEAMNGYMRVLTSCMYQWVNDYYDSPDSRSKDTKTQQLFDKFIDLVQLHYTREREVNFYADQMCMTSKYLSTIIRKHSGRYASDWIKDYVILEAKAMLKSKRYSVQQVCDELNFTNASFFGKYFKQAVGVSPGKYMLE